MSNILDTIKKHAAQYYQEVVEMRRYLHAHPELSMQEKETAAFIKLKLKEYNISFNVLSGILLVILFFNCRSTGKDAI